MGWLGSSLGVEGAVAGEGWSGRGGGMGREGRAVRVERRFAGSRGGGDVVLGLGWEGGVRLGEFRDLEELLGHVSGGCNWTSYIQSFLELHLY